MDINSIDPKNKPMQTSGYVVLVEWDGTKPPTSWYNYLEKAGLTSHRGPGGGNKDISPLSRRVGPWGVSFQEGAIVVNSHSKAEEIARMAKGYRAISVSIGEITVESFQMSLADKVTLQKVLDVTSKRGPKPKAAEGRYVVMCFEEAITSTVDLRENPTHCPTCGGNKILWWRSDDGLRKVPAFNPQTDNLDKYWLTTRFDETGRFSIPQVAKSAKLPTTPDVTTFEQGTQNQIVQVNQFCNTYAEQIDGNGLEILRAMDIAFCIQTLSSKLRLGKRVEALREYYAGGGKLDYKMSVNPLAVDIADVAGLDKRFVKKL